MLSGPYYESQAESRLLHQAGGDVVGMSTVPEILVARHCGMTVMALSVVAAKVSASNFKINLTPFRRANSTASRKIARLTKKSSRASTKPR